MVIGRIIIEHPLNDKYISGAVDGTHIVIDPPTGKKEDYIDRKGKWG